MSLETWFFAGALVLQVAALVFCILMVRQSAIRSPWYGMCAALVIMLVFRVLAVLSAQPNPVIPLSAAAYKNLASVGSLIISFLLLVSLFAIRRLAIAQKLAAEGLRISKELAEASLAQWKAIISSMTEGVIISDPLGNLVEWNPAALQMHRYVSVEEACHHMAGLPGAFQLCTPAGRVLNVDERPMTRALRGETFSNYELRLGRPEKGVNLAISYSGIPVRDRDGKIILALITLHDVTEERKAQDRLRENAERLSLALAAGDLGGWFWQADTDLMTLSSRAAEIFGVPADRPLTRTAMRELIDDEDRERARDAAARSARARVDYDVEYRVNRPDGKRIWVAARGRVTQDATGAVVGMLGVVLDISERKAAQEQRERLLESERAARIEAERNSRMKDEFLATLSHELRTPLNAILGWSQMLRLDASNASDLSQGLETIERNARAQTAIIEDLLDMSRIISGKIRLDVQRVDLRSVVEAAIETVRPAADAKGIRLQPVLDPRAGIISGDAGRLQQVFWNLLSNSVKFSPRGCAVRLVLQRVESHVEVSVIDAGEGISPEFLPHVFDRFRQADATTTRRHGGLGLGLSIVKQLVELHGGTVRVLSDGLGKGASFTVALPMSAIHPEELTPDNGTPATTRNGTVVPPGLNVDLTGVNVLVVDDEPDARSLIGRLLESCRATVTTAGAAEDALAALRTARFNILISDIGMPTDDGYALIRKVRALSPDEGGSIPAIALTAYARAEDRVKAVVAGFNLHVAKPVEAAELLTMVASLVGRMGPEAYRDGAAVG